MEGFLKRGVHRSIPVFAFFDEDMKEVARFIECTPAWRRPCSPRTPCDAVGAEVPGETLDVTGSPRVGHREEW